MIDTDIADRKRIEAQLLVHEAALKAAASGIVITDVQGAIQWVNPAFERMTGFTSAEVAGQTLRVLKSGRHDKEFYADMWKCILGGDVWKGEMRNRRKDGSLYDEESSITPVRNTDGHITHFISIKQDVSEKKQLRAQLRQAQKMEAFGQLAGGVAHDFNNILGVVIGYTGLLLEDDTLKDEAKSLLKEVFSAGERAANLTRQLLTFSRKKEMEAYPLDLNKVMGNMTRMLVRIIGEDIKLQCTYAPGLPAVRADEGMIEQVLMNLAVNARDAMPKGGQLSISTRPVVVEPEHTRHNADARAGSFVCLKVEDSGCGMTRRSGRASLSRSSRPKTWARERAWAWRPYLES